jgi:peptidylamidoglycolate lyase
MMSMDIGRFCRLALVCAAALGIAAFADTEPQFQVTHGWPKLSEGTILGQATGVDTDSHGRVFVFHRGSRQWSDPMPAEPISETTIAVFDASGNQVASWGAGLFIMPHGLTVDSHDNVWLTDVGSHQIFKFSADGKLLLTIGERGVPGNNAGHFNLPTDVAVRKDGSFYVSDGYENTRVVRYSAAGKFELQWGRPGTGPGEFDLPHAIALDDEGQVYVADRSNARVQIFKANGEFVAQWKNAGIGRPYSLAVSGPRAVTVDGGDQPETGPDRSGAAIVNLDGSIVSRFGRFGNYDGQFRLAHDVAISCDGSIYVVDAWGQRVQRFTAKPGSDELYKREKCQ